MMRNVLQRMRCVMDKDIGIDLGTKNISVYVKGRGLVFHEPTVVAIKRGNGKVLALGGAAKRMLGRSSRDVQVVNPMREGVIADLSATEAIFRHMFEQVLGYGSYRRSKVMVCAPIGSTHLERRALRNAVQSVGARSMDMLDEPMAAALGAKLPVSEPVASMIVDIGGGITEAAIISLGGIVNHTSMRCGGEKMDEAIQSHVRRRHNMLISRGEAEEAKIRAGKAHPDLEDLVVTVRGRNLATGLPDAVKVTSAEIHEAIRDQVSAIERIAHEALERCPAELAGDLMTSGINLTGGGSLLRGMDDYLREKLGIPVRVMDDPLRSIVRGLGYVLESPTEA